MSAVKKAVCTGFAVAYALLLCAGLFFRALPDGAAERRLCIWEDGSFTEEETGALLLCFEGLSEEGDVLVCRGGVHGRVTGDEETAHAVSLLGGDDFAAIAAYRGEALSPLGRAAVRLAFRSRLYYSDGFFVWRDGLSAASPRRAEELVVFGELPASALDEVEVSRLSVTSSALLDDLSGHAFDTFSAEQPYFTDEDALYLQTAGGVRLIAAGANARKLVLGDYDFADRGALLASSALEELELPFAGNVRSFLGANADGLFAYLFSDGTSFRVPPSLRRVRVRGGKLVSHAFYACPSLAEIDACGVAAADIAADAFADCTGLQLLHAARADLLPDEEFTCTKLPCGCYEYRKIS